MKNPASRELYLADKLAPVFFYSMRRLQKYCTANGFPFHRDETLISEGVRRRALVPDWYLCGHVSQKMCSVPRDSPCARDFEKFANLADFAHVVISNKTQRRV